MKITLKLFTYWCMAIVLIITSCSDDNEPGVADFIDIVTGISQTATVGTDLPEPIEVIVKDQNGNVFAGAVVNFNVAEGTVSSSRATTDAGGKATTTWTLGASVGIQKLTVTAFRADGITPLKGAPFNVSATATAVPLFAESVDLHAGGGQSAIVETTLTNPVELVVKDQNGDVFEGTIVNFSVAEGSVSSATARTDASGIATISWTLGASEGTQILTATAFNADGTTPLTGSPISVVATATPKPIAIGDFYAGGVVFYVDGTGSHGMVCTVSDQSSGAEWGCLGTLIGANETTMGSGLQNTIDIEAGCLTIGTAADLCANLSLNDFNDWFLPSTSALFAMWENWPQIEATAIAHGGSGFADTNYWSSKEEDSNIAWVYHLGESSTGWTFPDKDALHYVRAVRAF